MDTPEPYPSAIHLTFCARSVSFLEAQRESAVRRHPAGQRDDLQRDTLLSQGILGGHGGVSSGEDEHHPGHRA